MKKADRALKASQIKWVALVKNIIIDDVKRQTVEH